MKHVHIGPISLGARPCIAAVVDAAHTAGTIALLCRGPIRLIEFRLDLLDMKPSAAVKFIRNIRARTRCGCIATYRETPANRATRLAALQEVLPHVDAVDEEISSAHIREVARMARGKTIILSHHDFKKTPDMAKILSLALMAQAGGASIFKIAALARTKNDAAALISFPAKSPLPCVAMAMGPFGALSRVAAPLFGSLFSYGYIGKKPVAPGQLHVKYLAELFSLLYP